MSDVNNEVNVGEKTEQFEPVMKSILDLGDYTFEIPVYQRGFRWTRQQMEELITDLNEFYNNSEGGKYCLQNVTVRKKTNSENTFEVIDGQQRLTALWILMRVARFGKDFGNKLKIYELKFIEKDKFQRFIDVISEENKEIKKKFKEEAPIKIGEDDKDDILEKTILSEKGSWSKIIKNYCPDDDIDAAMLNDALELVLEADDKKYFDFVENIFSPGGKLFRDKGKNEINIIWNNIYTPGGNEQDMEKYAIEKFSNINANKIPLTESELIKAYFINALSKEEVKDGIKEKFTFQWEEMEKGLNNDELWGFLSSFDVETRMDLLFKIFLNESTYMDEHQHELSNIIGVKLNEGQPEEIWKKILEIYQILNDWYEDYYYYHTIGLLITISDEEASQIIAKLYDSYTSKTKDEFKIKLKEDIKELYSKYLFEKIQNENAVADGETIYEMKLGNITYKDGQKVRNTLLLYNITLLLNAYATSSENDIERFSFRYYKRKNKSGYEVINIEHINPQSFFKNKNDYSLQDKVDWVETVFKIIKNPSETLRSKVEQKLEEAKIAIYKEGTKANRKVIDQNLISDIEEAANLDNIGNLTLLDEGINKSPEYGDNYFNKKRNIILRAKFGNSSDGKEYGNSIIFPGTMWVFNRSYELADETSDDNRKAYNKSDVWNYEDMEKYIDNMEMSIARFFDIKLNNNER